MNLWRFFFFLLIPFGIFSQNIPEKTDYVVTVKGDTLYGKISIQSFEKIDQVQVKGNKKETFTALQVKTIMYANEIYQPILYDNRVRFMKVLINGYVSLLAFPIENTNSYDGRLLMKLDGKKMEIPRLSFKKIMPDFFDEPELADSIAKGMLTRKDMDLIIDRYNKRILDRTASRISAPVTSKDNTLLDLASLLKQKIDDLEFITKNDALDIINDLKEKISQNKTVPNYLLNALKQSLNEVVEVQPALLQLLEKLQ